MEITLEILKDRYSEKLKKLFTYGEEGADFWNTPNYLSDGISKDDINGLIEMACKTK